MTQTKTRRPRRTYTDEFKNQLVQLYLNGKRKCDIVREYDISSSLLDKWIKQSTSTGSFKEKDNRSEEEQELIQLRKKVKQLEMENDILKQANDELGIKYIIEFAEDKFNIVPFRKVNVQFRYKSTSSESLTESILEMKNSIIVTSNEQEEVEILAIAKDEANIERYGSLQEVITVSPDEDEAKVRNIAKTKLKELNKVFRTASLQGFGDDEFKAGRVIELNNQEFFLQGEYLIKNCSHTWVKGEHLVNLEVELYEE